MGIALRGHRAANRLVTSTSPANDLPLKCHSPEGGTRFQVRKTLTTWSPLTESNRRPSPYHVSLRCSVSPARSLICVNTSTDQHSQAPDGPTRTPFATQSATHIDLVPLTRSLYPEVAFAGDQPALRTKATWLPTYTFATKARCVIQRRNLFRMDLPFGSRRQEHGADADAAAARRRPSASCRRNLAAELDERLGRHWCWRPPQRPVTRATRSSVWQCGSQPVADRRTR